MGLRAAPQTWLSAFLCLAGVGVLEFYNPATNTFSGADVDIGDAWALAQAVGLGSCWFVTEELVNQDTDQVLPVTAVQVSTMALTSLLWVLWDNSFDFGLLHLFTDPSLKTSMQIIVWMGVM